MHILNHFFDKIYCINLDRRPDRWEESCKLFREKNITVQRVSACDGKDFKSPFGHRYDSEVACTISHLNAIRDGIINNYKNILIFEDDIVFSDSFDSDIKGVLGNIPSDWDIFYFGANHIKDMEKINRNIFRLNGSLTAHCYAINKKSLIIINDYLTSVLEDIKFFSRKITPVVIDGLLVQLFSRLNVYGVYPNMAWQRESFSDLRNMNINYKILIPKSNEF